MFIPKFLKKLISVEITEEEDLFFPTHRIHQVKEVVQPVVAPLKKRVRVRPPRIRKPIVVKGGENMKGTPEINEARELMDRVLNLLREEHKKASASMRGRELALALTYFEDGCMRMIRSEHAQAAYSPLLRLKEDVKPAQDVAAPVAPVAPASTPDAQPAPAVPETPEPPVAPEVPAAPVAGNPAEGTVAPETPEVPATPDVQAAPQA